MPQIKGYTRQSLPQQTIQAQARPQAFGGDQSAALDQAEALQDFGGMVAEAVQQKNTREDVINKAKLVAQYHEEMQQEYLKTTTEKDLALPGTNSEFNNFVREKTQEYLMSFQGSEQARADLEVRLTGLQGSFVSQMNNDAFNAQQSFIMNTVGSHVNDISSRAYADPSNLAEYFKEFDATIKEYAPALDSQTEIEMIESGQAAIMQNVLNSFVDAGDYERARGLINENPFFVDSIPPEKLKTTLSQINNGIAERDKVMREMRQKTNAIRSVAQELNIDISPAQVFTAATGISNAQGAQAKVQEFASIIGKNADDLDPAIIAKIGYGVDLPGVDVDFNKERLPDGGYTPKGISGQIKAPYEAAAASKMYQNKVIGAIDLFRQDGNKQALLSAMISFQKALDDGAIVREGDIILQRQAQGISDRISLFLKPGQVVGDELVDEMEATINDFTAKSLESSKVQIDPFIEEAKSRGYRPVDYGLPVEAYDEVFAGVKTKKKRDSINQSTFTLDEFLEQ